jgi:protein-S-isoprenylcysteine O-methyltransferase Ste14
VRSADERHSLQAWFPKPYADFVQRLRVGCGFLLLAAFAWLSRPSATSMLIGVPISVAGLAIRAWASGHLVKDQQLATAGPYAYLRNPLYAGTLAVALGMVIAARNVWLAAIFIASFAFIYFPAIELEEQHLGEIFPQYAEYAKRVCRFLPLRSWKGSQARFSWARYRRNEEYKALIGFLVALAWLFWKCYFLKPHA